MTFILSQTPARGELYSSAAGDFTVTVNAGTKTVTISDPGFALTPNAIQVAQLWTVAGTVFSKQDIPINTIGISGFAISFEDLGSNLVGTERVEIFILGPKKGVTETNSGAIKTAVEANETLLTAIKDTDGIKKILDSVTVAQPSAAALLNTEVNSGDIKTAVEAVADTVSVTANAQRTSEVDPLNQQYVYEETELVNIASGTAGYIYFDWDGFRYGSFECLWDALATDVLTLTIEATNRADGTAPASIPDAEWLDITDDRCDASSYTADEFIDFDTPLGARYVRIKYVTSGGTGDSDLTVLSKKYY